MTHKKRNPSTDLKALIQRGFRYALSLTHQKAKAEDLLQDALIKVLDKNEGLNPGYLFTTIRHRWIDTLRRDKIIPFTSLDDEKKGDKSIRNRVKDTRLMNYEEQDQMERALSHLKAEEREIIYLSVVEGYTTREIATLFDKPKNTILSTLHRSKKKLKAILEKETAKAAG